MSSKDDSIPCSCLSLLIYDTPQQQNENRGIVLKSQSFQSMTFGIKNSNLMK